MFGLRQGGFFGDSVSATLFPQTSGGGVRLRGLNARDWRQHADHLQRLTPEDRRARFHSAIGDAAIQGYARHMDWRRAFVFGVFVRGTLRAVGELIPMDDPGRTTQRAEVSVSVERPYQQSGFGKMLMLAMFLAARKLGIRRLHMLWHSDNDRMRALARDVGARTRCLGGVMEGVVMLPGHDLPPRIEAAADAPATDAPGPA